MDRIVKFIYHKMLTTKEDVIKYYDNVDHNLIQISYSSEVWADKKEIEKLSEKIKNLRWI